MTEHAAAVAQALARFPRARTWLLPALQAVQEVVGYLPDWALAHAGRYLRVPVSEVHGVASGYPEFRQRPRGAHHARVCTGVSCALSGGRALLDAICRAHAVQPGEGGADRSLTIEEVDCLFECAMAPLVEVDDCCHGRVTLDDVARLGGWYRPAPVAHTPPVSASPPGESPGSLESPEAFLDRLVGAAGNRRRGRPRLRLVVHAGTCGRAVGTDRLTAALRQALDGSPLDAEVIESACPGMCYAAPSIEFQKEGWPRALIERLEVAAVPRLLERLASDDLGFTSAGLAGLVWADAPWRDLTPAGAHPFWGAQARVLLARCGLLDPEDIDDALLHGAYRALARALGRPAVEVIDTVRASGLQGRGGAFFPAGSKWEACRRAAGEPKYLIVNGEEGEPGTFKDRHLMEGDPHQLLEGALLAAYAAGATRMILYVHGEAHLSAARLARAVAQAEAAGILGDRVLGCDWSCGVELRRGSGGFVLGEETALLESIEGRRAQPRTRPPFPVESGLWGRPTVINNVETLSAVPAIVGAGASWFAALGTPKAPGTKIFALSGPIRRPGVVEVNSGVSLRALLDGIGGGTSDGRAWLGAVVGGPSGTIVPAALFDVPMEPRERVSPGTGGIVALPAGASVVDVVRMLLRFNVGESCGKCTPCREGTPRLLAIIDEPGSEAGRPEEPARVGALAEAIQLASLCGLGQAAPLALLRALETFPEAFRRRA
jgi:NADH:ubiquinone oxidoreductase subunit F (NADH-binding)/NADH:ubiquinone oxidoreductase subunit E